MQAGGVDEDTRNENDLASVGPTSEIGAEVSWFEGHHEEP